MHKAFPAFYELNSETRFDTESAERVDEGIRLAEFYGTAAGAYFMERHFIMQEIIVRVLITGHHRS